MCVAVECVAYQRAEERASRITDNDVCRARNGEKRRRCRSRKTTIAIASRNFAMRRRAEVAVQFVGSVDVASALPVDPGRGNNQARGKSYETQTLLFSVLLLSFPFLSFVVSIRTRFSRGRPTTRDDPCTDVKRRTNHGGLLNLSSSRDTAGPSRNLGRSDPST